MTAQGRAAGQAAPAGPVTAGDRVNAVHATGTPARIPAQASVPVPGQAVGTIVRLGGDLDIATAPALRERLHGMLRPGTRLLIIDLSGVSSCEVAGLAVLIGTQRRAAARGITVRLAAPGPQVAELLRVTGLDRNLMICATPAGVLPPRRRGRRRAAPPQRAEAA